MPQLDEESAIIMALFHDVVVGWSRGKPLFLVEEHLATSALGFLSQAELLLRQQSSL